MCSLVCFLNAGDISLKASSLMHECYWLEYDWSNNPIRPALLRLLHLPTLTHFKVNVNLFLVSDLIPCVNLKYLDIGHTSVAADNNTFPSTLPEHSIQLNEFVAGFGASDTIVKLCTARRPDGADHRFWVSVQDNGGFRMA
jgi:hypothetical protein